MAAPPTQLEGGGRITTMDQFKAFLSRMKDGASITAAQRKPWSEMVDVSNIAKPDSLNDVQTRIRKNLAYFRVNYMICMVAVIVLSLLWNPTSLLVIAVLLAGWAFMYVFRTDPVVLFSRTLSEKEVLALMSVVTLVVVFLLTGVGSLLISTLVVGLLLICVHAALRVPDDLFIDEPESSGGLLSVFGATPILPVSVRPTIPVTTSI